MQKRFLLLIALCIFIVSTATFFLILHYLDPYVNMVLGIALISTTFVLSVSTFLTVFLYFVKKVYYRGKVGLYNVITSFRQGFLVALYALSLVVFQIINVNLFFTSVVMFVLLSFIEMFAQNLEN